MFLSLGQGCPKEDPASHWVAVICPTNYPMTEPVIAFSLWYCVSFPHPRELLPRGCYPISLKSRRRLPRIAASGTLSVVPYRSRLLCPQGQRRRGTSPVWMKPRYLQMMTPRTRSAGKGIRIAALQETERGLDPMLRHKGGGSHVVQANAPPFGVTLAGLFATSVACDALAASPRSRCGPEVLPTFSAQVRTRTGRIKSMLPTWTAPFFIRLSISSIRFTRPYGADAFPNWMIISI